jgi:ankyrin repeat protein
MVTYKKNKHKIRILHTLSIRIPYQSLSEPTRKIKYVDDEGRTPLMLACIQGNLDDVKTHISELECIDDDGWTALMYACHHGHAQIVNFLLENNVDVYKTTLSGLKANQLAYFNGHYEISQML